MALDQDSFRFRNDDGSETTASWKDALNTDITLTVAADEDFRIRFLVQSDGAESIAFRLQYNHNSGGWNNVSDVSSVIQTVGSANFADDDPTTQQIGAGSFLVGFMDDLEGVSPSGFPATIDFAGGDETEVEFMCRVLEADTDPGDVIDLRLIRSGSTELDTYTQTPTISVQAGAESPDLDVAPDSVSEVIRRRYRSGRGGHFAESFEPFYTDPETVTADKFAVEYPAVTRRKTWRPEGHFAYTEVPVLPDVIEHGWEVPLQLQMRRLFSRYRGIIGAHYTTVLLDEEVTNAIACIGELTVEPKWSGGLKATPKYVGELDFNVEGG